ncbi:xylan O-acetyltransferase 1-like [Salvia hispanica]|uniref:xylan O-acetyltransferase 1-like n=1 Tax=Salvia hispanica TaxID=49212 RepID=UPI0020093E08|nr:xylan O-acetyltransferase 1-like [Salvia hispanica]
MAQTKCKNSPLFFSLISLFLFSLISLTKDVTFIAQLTLRWHHIQLLGERKGEVEEVIKPSISKQEDEEEKDGDYGIELPPKSCDLSKGKWVFDNITRPLYKEEKCEFLTTQVTCVRNGRKDLMYQNWRWQPNECSLPKFDAKVLLEKLRGKRLMFVGDSVNRNQWESMVCLLHTGIAPGRATWKVGAPLSVFSIQDYNATVEFYWAPFLVQSNSDDPRNHSISQRIIMPESIYSHGIHWKDADVLVFNTYIWWMNNQTIKVLRGSSDQESADYDEVQRCTAYERVMTTWADWLTHNVNHTRTASYFITMSPVHWQSSSWNNPDGAVCARETTPIMNTTMELDMGTDRRLLDIVKNTIKKKGIPVDLIDITTLSEYRKDAHTSVYTLRQGKLLLPEQKANPAAFADCLHWCLPGVPDTWNELLYTHIMSRS